MPSEHHAALGDMIMDLGAEEIVRRMRDYRQLLNLINGHTLMLHPEETPATSWVMDFLLERNAKIAWSARRREQHAAAFQAEVERRQRERRERGES